MSKLAKKSILIPEGVSVREDGRFAIVSGPKGEVRVRLPQDVEWQMKEGGIMVSSRSRSKQARASIGTAWSLIRNAVHGSREGFSKVLEIEGVGYKMGVDGDTIVLSLGYVNPVRIKIPKGLTASAEKNTLTILGIDKDLVGRISAEIRAQKKPEPYKGKGIHYRGEVIRRKSGKKAATATAA